MAGLVLLMSACAVHRPEVQQGNILEPAVLAKLHTGLSKKQVGFLLGTPIIHDAFHPDRWDYVYLLKEEDKPLVQKRVTVFFENDKVSRLETAGITLPSPGTDASPAAPASEEKK